MHKLVIPVYVAYSVSVLLAKLPIWILQYTLLPSTRGRPSWTLANQLLVNFLRDFIRITYTLGNSILRDLDAPLVGAHTLKSSHAVTINPVDRKYLKGIIEKAAKDVGGLEPVLKSGTGKVGPRKIPAYWYTGTKAAKDAQMQALSNTDDDLVLMNVHGGGYLFGSAHETDANANISRDLIKKSPITRVLSVEYRLAGFAPFPGALIDALSAYSYLLNECKIPPHRILIGGDSAGANLTLALARYLRDEKVFPMPAGLILLSPWADLTQSHWRPGTSAETNQKSDYVDADFGNAGANLYTKGHPANFKSNIYISPAATQNADKHSFDGFPKSWINAGGGEAMYTDILYLRDRMADSMGEQNVTLDVTPDAPHDILLYNKWGKTRDQTLQNLADWVAEHFPQAAKAKQQQRQGSKAKKLQ